MAGEKLAGNKPASSRRWHRFRRPFLLGLLVAIALWLLASGFNLYLASRRPVDAILVLGGSIRREIYVADLAKQQPEIPILISSGSQAPCIWLLFQRAAAPKKEVWLENCARSTFGNFYFSIPILRRWQARKVQLITSPTHLPRSRWLAQILLSAQGMGLELDIVEEQGIPGNRESWLKTGLDVGRSLVWAVASQFYAPHCQQVVSLASIDLAAWRAKGFHCEHQAGIQ